MKEKYAGTIKFPAGEGTGGTAESSRSFQMLPYILLIPAILIVIFLIIVALRPTTFRVTRSTSISAPPAHVFAQVNDLHNWEEWSPWAKLDPNAKRTFDGAPAGTGAIFGWSGNNKIGEGRMTITDSQPNELIRIRLEFFRPFKASNTAEFFFKPVADQTQVTWSMFGDMNFMSKAFFMFVSHERMLGPDFEKGLAQLKAVAEASTG